MAQNPKLQLKKFIDKIEKTVGRAVSPEEMKPLGEFAIGIIVKRTRLGYGVDTELGNKAKLKPLSDRYKEERKQDKSLSPMTSVGRSNLTRTSQMLDSTKVLSVRSKYILVGPSGRRTDSKYGNAKIAEFQASQGRKYMNLSMLEYKQMLRFYRRQFTDLIKKVR